MKVGPYAGRKVSEVKPIIREELIAAGQALPYSEPEKPVRRAGVRGRERGGEGGSRGIACPLGGGGMGGGGAKMEMLKGNTLCVFLA